MPAWRCTTWMKPAEDQRSAIQDWIDMLETWPRLIHPPVRGSWTCSTCAAATCWSNIERVVHHVRRLEQSTETVVQMHFSVQSNRTNDIIGTLHGASPPFFLLAEPDRGHLCA